MNPNKVRTAHNPLSHTPSDDALPTSSTREIGQALHTNVIAGVDISITRLVPDVPRA